MNIMGKLNSKKVTLILFVVIMSMDCFGCTKKRIDSTDVILTLQVETASAIKELSVQAPTNAEALKDIQSASTYSSTIINKFGSYEAYKKSILDDINLIRVQYGLGILITEWHAESIAQAVSEINGSMNTPAHIFAYDYPSITGMYRNNESCIVGFEKELLDPSFVVDLLTNYSTEKIVTDPDIIYVGFGLKSYENKIAIVVDAYSKAEFNSYIIGSQQIVETDPNGKQYLSKSIWGVN